MGTRAAKPRRRPFPLVFSLCLAVLASGCSTAVFVRHPPSRTFTEPAFEETKSFFFWGLVVDDQDVYVDKICLGREVDQVAVTYTPTNALVTALTLGIFSPRTAQVWCRL